MFGGINGTTSYNVRVAAITSGNVLQGYGSVTAMTAVLPLGSDGAAGATGATDTASEIAAEAATKAAAEAKATVEKLVA